MTDNTLKLNIKVEKKKKEQRNSYLFILNYVIEFISCQLKSEAYPQ